MSTHYLPLQLSILDRLILEGSVSLTAIFFSGRIRAVGEENFSSILLCSMFGGLKIKLTKDRSAGE